MAVTLDLLKQSLRIDGTADDVFLTVYLKAAINNLARPIGCPPTDDFLANNPEFDTAVLMLAGHYWTHRLAVSDAALTEIPAGINSIYWPLKLEYAILKNQQESDSSGTDT